MHPSVDITLTQSISVDLGYFCSSCPQKSEKYKKIVVFFYDELNLSTEVPKKKSRV